MSIDVDRVLKLLDQSRINRDVLMAHDEARESFRLPTMRARDAREFKWIVTTYYRHHMQHTGQGTPSEDQAAGEVYNLLNNIYQEDRYQEGYNVALRMGLEGGGGGFREVINQIADALKRRAMQKYIDHVYLDHVSPVSKSDNLELARAYFRRFGGILREFGVEVDEFVFATNMRAAFEYHRQVLEQIFGIAKKI
ncbi:MAG: hypothetical protein M0000_12830 [Actinomycetota bacterium]|nr:hypothetical protein [Actinomycetota bacterium]